MGSEINCCQHNLNSARNSNSNQVVNQTPTQQQIAAFQLYNFENYEKSLRMYEESKRQESPPGVNSHFALDTELDPINDGHFPMPANPHDGPNPQPFSLTDRAPPKEEVVRSGTGSATIPTATASLGAKGGLVAPRAPNNSVHHMLRQEAVFMESVGNESSQYMQQYPLFQKPAVPQSNVITRVNDQQINLHLNLNQLADDERSLENSIAQSTFQGSLQNTENTDRKHHPASLNKMSNRTASQAQGRMLQVTEAVQYDAVKQSHYSPEGRLTLCQRPKSSLKVSFLKQAKPSPRGVLRPNQMQPRLKPTSTVQLKNRNITGIQQQNVYYVTHLDQEVDGPHDSSRNGKASKKTTSMFEQTKQDPRQGYIGGVVRASISSISSKFSVKSDENTHQSLPICSGITNSQKKRQRSSSKKETSLGSEEKTPFARKFSTMSGIQDDKPQQFPSDFQKLSFDKFHRLFESSSKSFIKKPNQQMDGSLSKLPSDFQKNYKTASQQSVSRKRDNKEPSQFSKKRVMRKKLENKSRTTNVTSQKAKRTKSSLKLETCPDAPEVEEISLDENPMSIRPSTGTSKSMAVVNSLHVTRLEEENSKLKQELEKYKSSFVEMKSSMIAHEQIRKIQQQQILSLKGNMRVFCRVKPLDQHELCLSPYDDPSCVRFPQKVILDSQLKKQTPQIHHQTLELGLSKYMGSAIGSSGKHLYNFDGVFLPDQQQSDIFSEIKPFVQSALDGLNTCIFAYGQTGSGKTHTMEGDIEGIIHEEGQTKLTSGSGILPRIAIYIHEEMKRIQKQFHREIRIDVSALEIYCEQIRDLLSPVDNTYLELKNTQDKKNVCPGQTWVPIFEPNDFLKEIESSHSKRIFKNNGTNQRSSRSHHVFQIRIHTYNKFNKRCTSFLNIVDLAGSERRSVLQEFNSLQSNVNSFQNLKDQGRRTRVHSLKKKNSRSIQHSPKFTKEENYREEGERSPSNKRRKRFMSTNVQDKQQETPAGLSRFHQSVQGPPSGANSVVKNSSTFNVSQANFVNLESSLQTGAQSDLKLFDLETESKFINKNLTTLGRIFSILSNRKTHGTKGAPVPPYRECKLTRLLQSSLQYGENCRTVMIVTICQNKANSQQSKESLDFAQKATVAF